MLIFPSNQWKWSYFWTHRTLWKNEKIYSHPKNISSKQLFSNLFSKTDTLTKFLPKLREREFPKFPHCAPYGNDGTLALFWKKFCESNIFAKEVTEYVIWRNFFSVRVLCSWFPQYDDAQWKNLVSPKVFRQINYLVVSLVKTLL